MKEFNILLFKMKDQLFGIDAEEIVEVMEYENIDYGSETMIITYLGDVLGLEEEINSSDNKKIIVSNCNGELMGFIVDEVIQLQRVPENSVHNAPKILLTDQNGFIDKFCIANDQLFPMINLAKLSVFINK